MVALKFLLVISTGALATAANLDQRAVACPKANGCYNALKGLGSLGASFCKAYLNTPCPTTTITITPTVTKTTSTTTVNVASSQCPATNPYRRRGLVGEAADVPVQDFEKRVNIPPQLKAYSHALIVEACRCLDSGPKVTKTVTRTARPTTTKVVATKTQCVEGCLPDDLDSSCSRDDQCCSGNCQIAIIDAQISIPNDHTTCCRPNNSPCILENPELCCGGGCVFDPDDPNFETLICTDFSSS